MLTVADVMTKEVITVTKDMSIRELAGLFARHRISSAPVVDAAGDLLGVVTESDLIEQLKPGVDGLVIEDEGCRGTFLPSVWESLPKPADFLCHLKMKAGLRPDYWSPTIKVARYTAEMLE